MGFGLQKNSPVKLQLNKPNYEALIERHGQFVRWRITKLCPCVTDNNRPDIHCPFCGGSGETYDYQKDYINSYRASAQNGIITLSDEYKDAEVLEVWNYQNKNLGFVQYCDILQITGCVGNGEVVEIKIKVPLTKTTDTTLTRITGNIYRACDVVTPSIGIEGAFSNSPCDIVSATVTDSSGDVLTPIGFRQNLVYVESAEDILQASVEYVLPVKFAILSQELTKEDFNIVQNVKGDAMCTFPYYMNLSEKDVITVLSGTMTMKHVMKHGEADTLPQFFIESVISCESIGQKYEYGKDFIIAGTNVLKWLNPPPIGTVLSFVFNYNPTYRVLQEIPMLRTSENQKLPKKVAISLFSGFMENRNLEMQ